MLGVASCFAHFLCCRASMHPCGVNATRTPCATGSAACHTALPLYCHTVEVAAITACSWRRVSQSKCCTATLHRWPPSRHVLGGACLKANARVAWTRWHCCHAHCYWRMSRASACTGLQSASSHSVRCSCFIYGSLDILCHSEAVRARCALSCCKALRAPSAFAAAATN